MTTNNQHVRAVTRYQLTRSLEVLPTSTKRRAAAVVCGRVQDRDAARELLDVLGLLTELRAAGGTG